MLWFFLLHKPPELLLSALSTPEPQDSHIVLGQQTLLGHMVTSGLNLVDTWCAGPVNSICVDHLQKRLSLKSLEDKTTKYNSSFSDVERPVSTNWSPCLLYKYKDNFNPHKTFPVLYKDKFQLHKIFWRISPALLKQLWVFHILWALSSSLEVLLLLIWSNNNLPTWHKISPIPFLDKIGPAINCWPDTDNKAPSSALIKMIAAMATTMATKVVGVVEICWGAC